MYKLKMTKRIEDTGGFDQVLLSYVEMCYSVALALTRDPEEARDLARDVLISAWHRHGAGNGKTHIKRELLLMLRETFLQDYRGGMRHLHL